MPRPEKPKRIPKKSLRSLLKQGKTRKAIAKRYRISEWKLDGYIGKYRLSHLVRKGRRAKSKKPDTIRPKRVVETWTQARSYVNDLNEQYNFVNINYPPEKYVNQRTLVCSNKKRNPTGSFTTVGIYSIVYVSNVYFLFAISIRYSQQPKPFKEIYNWVSSAAPAILEESYHSSYFVVRIVAYTFSRPARKPRAVHYV
jgi:hypothetical protein